MSIIAIVQNDTIKLPDGVHLPDGTKVHIEPEAAPTSTLAERLAPFIGAVHSGVGDLAANHNHYLYGAPKKQP